MGRQTMCLVATPKMEQKCVTRCGTQAQCLVATPKMEQKCVTRWGDKPHVW